MHLRVRFNTVKISNLHIQAFGKLEDVTLAFSPGMNLYAGDNEFGKSTILSFIRAMFYGFPQRGPARMKDYDRRKFIPWNGRSFGGSITFTHEGNAYLLEKTFMKKRADDRLSLTLLPSGQKVDLAQMEVGEYLFRISESEFVNTVFVGQLSSNILTTDKDTGMVSDRLANLADTGSELYSREVIKARLTGAASRLQALRGPGGLIPGIEEERKMVCGQEAELERIEEQAETLLGDISSGYEKEKQIRNELQEISRQLEEKNARSEELQAQIRKQEIRLQAVIRNKQQVQEKAAERHAAERDRRVQLQHREEISSLLQAEYAEIEAEICRLRKESEEYKIRTDGLIRGLDVLLAGQTALVHDAKALYDSKVLETSKQEKEILILSSEIKSLIQQREDVRKGHIWLMGHEIRSKRYAVLFLAAFAVSMGALILLKDPMLMTGFIFLALAAGLFIFNRAELYRLNRVIVSQCREYDTKMLLFEKESAGQHDRETTLHAAENKREELSLQKQRIQESAEKEIQNKAYILKRTEERLGTCAGRIGQIDRTSGSLSAEGSPTAGEDRADPADPAEGKAKEQDELSDAEISDMDTEIRSLEIQVQTAQMKNASILREISMLRIQDDTLKTKLSAVRVETARSETVRENVLSQAPDRSWIMEQKELLADRLGQAKAYHRALLIAQDALDEAFSKMENIFAPQVNEKAGEYLSRLTGGTYSTIHVDRSFSVDVASDGNYGFHPADYFSGGTVDQIYLALRLAIADLVQPKTDKMPLLLDDAFVQYDDKRAKAALVLLRELSADRQIVLFTCHGRMKDLYADTEDDKGQ